MTTTPAPTVLDTLKALEQAATPAPWRMDEQYSYDEYPLYGPDGAVGLTWSVPDVEFVVAARNALPALLDELATERRQGAAMASITGEAIRQLGEERDAAREELAKTRAELDEAQAVVEAAKVVVARVKAAPHSWRHDDTHALIAAVDSLANPATTAEPADEPKATCGAEHTTVIYPIKQPTTVVCTAHEGKRHVNAFTGFSWLDAEPAAS